jgi:hypothetical protein
MRSRALESIGWVLILALTFWVRHGIALAMAAVLAAGPSPGRRGAASFLVLACAALTLLSSSDPSRRYSLALLTFLVFMKTTQIASSRTPWPAHRRVWHLFATFDVRQSRRVAPALDWRLLAHVLIASALFGIVVLVLSHLEAHGRPSLELLRLAGGVVGFYAGMEAGSAAMQLGHRIAGLEVPPMQRAPLLAKRG